MKTATTIYKLLITVMLLISLMTAQNYTSHRATLSSGIFLEPLDNLASLPADILKAEKNIFIGGWGINGSGLKLGSLYSLSDRLTAGLVFRYYQNKDPRGPNIIVPGNSITTTGLNYITGMEGSGEDHSSDFSVPVAGIYTVKNEYSAVFTNYDNYLSLDGSLGLALNLGVFQLGFNAGYYEDPGDDSKKEAAYTYKHITTDLTTDTETYSLNETVNNAEQEIDRTLRAATHGVLNMNGALSSIYGILSLEKNWDKDYETNTATRIDKSGSTLSTTYSGREETLADYSSTGIGLYGAAVINPGTLEMEIGAGYNMRFENNELDYNFYDIDNNYNAVSTSLAGYTNKLTTKTHTAYINKTVPSHRLNADLLIRKTLLNNIKLGTGIQGAADIRVLEYDNTTSDTATEIFNDGDGIAEAADYKLVTTSGATYNVQTWQTTIDITIPFYMEIPLHDKVNLMLGYRFNAEIEKDETISTFVDAQEEYEDYDYLNIPGNKT
ncbi:MAG TPA: hypothetical protein VKS21_02175, partial [Spirochaetota bacterium]|nr:hypothetical protein [Spirochaetota bacterium]